MDSTIKQPKGFPNFLGDDFLLITANLFLLEAGLKDVADDEKGRFLEKIMPDFLNKGTAMILNALKEDQVKEALRISELGAAYSEKEAEYKKLIPDFSEKMSMLMDLYKRKIELGVYSAPENK